MGEFNLQTYKLESYSATSGGGTLILVEEYFQFVIVEKYFVFNIEKCIELCVTLIN